MGRRERKTDSIREMTKRGSFFSFFFRRATLPASKSTSSSPSRESIRLTPPPLLPSDIHLSPTGGPPGSRHASRAGQIEGTEALLEESRAKNEQGERDLIVVDIESERQGRRRQARESRAVAGALGFRAPLNLGPPRRLFSPRTPSLFSSKNTDRRPPPLRCGLRPRRLRDLHAGRADEGHRPALGRAGEFSISFFLFLFLFLFPTPCLSLAVPARALIVFLSPPFLSFPLSCSFFLLPLFPNLRTSQVASP